MSNIIWWVGGFIFVLTPIVIVHELGHFIAAKMSGIKVLQFGIGFPPVAKTLFTRNGTEYVIGWIPLGGFVRPAGEDDPNVEGGLAASSKRARLTTLAAGSIFNLIFAFFIFTLLFTLPRPVMQILVDEVAPNSPAAVSGLETGDILVEVNDQTVGENYGAIIEEIRSSAGSEVSILVNRDGSEQMITTTPRLPDETPEGEGSLGIRMGQSETGATTRVGVIEAAGLSAFTIYDFMREMVTLPARYFRNQIAPGEARMVSVVGISQIAGEAARTSVEENRAQDILWVMGIISIALGVTNLLPLPALDGGRILFVLIEAIRGRRIEPEREGFVHAIGMMLLLGLMVVLVVQDIVNPIVLPG
ncbi:MAG: RIP metalloprotease [Anaerolineae bacterium]